MNQNKMLAIVCAGGILTLLSGCGPKVSQVSSSAEKPSSSTQAEVRNESQSYITIAEAKAAVLENVGLSEENVKFVRINLDVEGGVAKYDLEFISEAAGYDYVVNALTGEILSLVCESRPYDIENVPREVQQAAEGQTEAESVPSESIQAAEEQAKAESMPSDAAQSVERPSETTDLPSETAQGQSEVMRQYIGVEAAKKIALDHAGLQADAVRFVHAHLEFDNGYWQYDVEFHKDGTEYDYGIDAQSGKVISYDYDAEYYQHGIDNLSGSKQITRDRAKQIALEYSGVAETEVRNLEVEFDFDDGRAEYQVEWYVGWMEYSCDVDASTGAVLGFEKEFD